ncbi:MAG: hypothetical protein ABI549_02285 [Flavobacterium sp.]|uniref:hypothetical protein n=1 Tax=Flavobacterium sp. TaxID=239 RepID=UPI00326301D8
MISKTSNQSIEADVYLGEDAFRYKYFIANSVLSKIKDSENFQYKNIALGKITSINIYNPFKIILFYENFNSAIILDNQLNEIQKINFSENKKQIVTSVVGISFQNNLWVFNATNQQIGLYDYLKNEYKNISVPISATIKYYETNSNFFYWIDEKNYWYSCDIFGKIIALGKLPDFDFVQIVSNLSIIFKKDDLLYHYSLNSNKKILINIEEKRYKKFYYRDQNLSIFTPEGITNYKINLP